MHFQHVSLSLTERLEASVELNLSTYNHHFVLNTFFILKVLYWEYCIFLYFYLSFKEQQSLYRVGMSVMNGGKKKKKVSSQY